MHGRRIKPAKTEQQAILHKECTQISDRQALANNRHELTRKLGWISKTLE